MRKQINLTTHLDGNGSFPTSDVRAFAPSTRARGSATSKRQERQESTETKRRTSQHTGGLRGGMELAEVVRPVINHTETMPTVSDRHKTIAAL